MLLPLLADPLEFLAGAKNAPYIAVDTESTMEDQRDGRGYAMGISIAYYPPDRSEIHSAYFPFRHVNGINYDRDVLEIVKTVLENHACLIFHNAKFDLVALETLGIKCTGFFYDTMLMFHYVDENAMSKALDYMAKTRLGDEGKQRSEDMVMVREILGWNNLFPEHMHEYAAYDTDMTLRGFENLALPFGTEKLEDQWRNFDVPFVRAIKTMEKNGIRIDQDLSRREAEKGEARMNEIKRVLKGNPGSPVFLNKMLIEELGLPVFKWTTGGKSGIKKPSFDKEAMERYESVLEGMDDERASLVLEYRGWQKTCSSNYRAYLDLVSPDGRLRPNYKLHGTKTGRLSCEKPNLQQIPRTSDRPWNGNLKAAFIPRPGYRLIDVDFSQVEFRLAAAYAKDPLLVSTFNNPDLDIFTEMSKQLGMKRQDVKTLVYTTLYGGGVNRISDVFKVSPQEAAMIRNNFFSTYSGLKQISYDVQRKIEAVGYIEMWYGRRRHLKKDEAFKGFNSMLQGGAAEIVKRALLRCTQYESPDCHMLLTVHDSVVFEIKEDAVDSLVPQIVKTMEDTDTDFGVTFRVQAKEWGSE